MATFSEREGVLDREDFRRERASVGWERAMCARVWYIRAGRKSGVLGGGMDCAMRDWYAPRRVIVS